MRPLLLASLAVILWACPGPGASEKGPQWLAMVNARRTFICADADYQGGKTDAFGALVLTIRFKGTRRLPCLVQFQGAVLRGGGGAVRSQGVPPAMILRHNQEQPAALRFPFVEGVRGARVMLQVSLRVGIEQVVWQIPLYQRATSK